MQRIILVARCTGQYDHSLGIYPGWLLCYRPRFGRQILVYADPFVSATLSARGCLMLVLSLMVMSQAKWKGFTQIGRRHIVFVSMCNDTDTFCPAPRGVSLFAGAKG